MRDLNRPKVVRELTLQLEALMQSDHLLPIHRAKVCGRSENGFSFEWAIRCLERIESFPAAPLIELGVEGHRWCSLEQPIVRLHDVTAKLVQKRLRISQLC